MDPTIMASEMKNMSIKHTRSVKNAIDVGSWVASQAWVQSAERGWDAWAGKHCLVGWGGEVVRQVVRYGEVNLLELVHEMEKRMD